MARSRNIKPALFKNEILGVADPLYTIVFEGLWVLADKEGRLEDRPLRIKAEILPYREGVSMDEMLNWLHSNGFIQRYTINDRRYIVVLEFKKHQNPHKNETESEIPAPDFIGTGTEKIGTTRADSLNLIPDSLNLIPVDEPSGSEVVDSPKKKRADGAELPGFVAFWEAWPSTERKQAKGKCMEVWRKSGAEDETKAIVAHVDFLKTSQSWMKNSGEYIPAPLVYLNQRRWEGAGDASAPTQHQTFI